MHTELYSLGDRDKVHEISHLARGTCHCLKRQASVSEVWFEKIAIKKKRCRALISCDVFWLKRVELGKEILQETAGRTNDWQMRKPPQALFPPFPQPHTRSYWPKSCKFKHVSSNIHLLFPGIQGCFIFLFLYFMCDVNFTLTYSGKKRFRIAAEGINSSLRAKSANGSDLKKTVFRNWCNRSAILQQIAFIATPACFSFFPLPSKGHEERKTALVVLLQQLTVRQQMLGFSVVIDIFFSLLSSSRGFSRVRVLYIPCTV